MVARAGAWESMTSLSFLVFEALMLVSTVGGRSFGSVSGCGCGVSLVMVVLEALMVVSTVGVGSLGSVSGCGCGVSGAMVVEV